MAGMNTFLVECVFHWSCKTEKGRQRISLSCDLEMPFPPSVGLCIEIGEELPSPKITEVVWCHATKKLCVTGSVRLKNWSSDLFESLVEDIRQAGPEYEPTLFNDDWMYAIRR
jgi:hypothetical protein